MEATGTASVSLTAAFAGAMLWFAGAGHARPAAEPGGVKSSSPPIAALVKELENWLDREGRYKRRNIPVTVRIVEAEVLPSADKMPGVQSFALRGYYDPSSATIYLFEPWSVLNPYDVSVLLHELVHHRQHSLPYWECPNAQERPAYRLQEHWLRERGLDAHFNWLAVLLLSRCRTAPLDTDSKVMSEASRLS
jgi:hypothetical protein